MSEWIRVVDKLPNESDKSWYALWDEEGGCPPKIVAFMKGSFVDIEQKFFRRAQGTHWMRLPRVLNE